MHGITASGAMQKTKAFKTSHLTTHCGTFGANSSSKNTGGVGLKGGYGGASASEHNGACNPFSLRISLASGQNETNNPNFVLYPESTQESPAARRNIIQFRNV